MVLPFLWCTWDWCSNSGELRWLLMRPRCTSHQARWDSHQKYSIKIRKLTWNEHQRMLSLKAFSPPTQVTCTKRQIRQSDDSAFVIPIYKHWWNGAQAVLGHIWSHLNEELWMSIIQCSLLSVEYSWIDQVLCNPLAIRSSVFDWCELEKIT